MEGYATGFDASGSVMSRKELENFRKKRGECVTCGRKCFQKKLLRMVPLTEDGKVLNGRCLNCKPVNNNSGDGGGGGGGLKPAATRELTREEKMRFSVASSQLHMNSTANSTELKSMSSSASTSGDQQQQQRSGERPERLSRSKKAASTRNFDRSMSGDRSVSGDGGGGRGSRNLGQRQQSMQSLPSNVITGNASTTTSNSTAIMTFNGPLSAHLERTGGGGDSSNGPVQPPPTMLPPGGAGGEPGRGISPSRGQEQRAMPMPPQHGPQRTIGAASPGPYDPTGVSLPIDSGYGMGGSASSGSGLYRSSNGSGHYQQQSSHDDRSVSGGGGGGYDSYDVYNHSHSTINTTGMHHPMTGESMQEIMQARGGGGGAGSQRALSDADDYHESLARAAGMASHPAASALIDYYRQSYGNQRESSFRGSNRSLHSQQSSVSQHHASSPEGSYHAYDTGQLLMQRNAAAAGGGGGHFDGISVSSGSTTSIISGRDSWQGSARQLTNRSVSSQSNFSGDSPDVIPGTPTTSLGGHVGGDRKQRSVAIGGVGPHLDAHFSRYSDDLSQSQHSAQVEDAASVVSHTTHRTATSHTISSGAIGGGMQNNSASLMAGNQYSCGRLVDSGSHTSSSVLSMTLASRDNAGMERIRQAGTDFLEIVAIMRDFCDSAPVQLMGMQELSNLQLSAQDIDEFVHIGAVDVICDGMRNYPMDVELQISGCRAIWNATATAVSQIAFVEAGAIAVIHMGMAQYLDDADVQEQSMATLANLAAIERNVGIMIECNVATCIVEAMNKHVENVHVQKKGCSAITNMASHNTPFKRTLMEMGSGGAVVIAMVMHQNDFILQERALRALRNLSANCDENKVELANIGGIDAVISAMQVHRDSGGVQEAGAWTLSNLAGNPDNKVLIGDYGGIDVTIRAMWVHSDNEKVQEWCCRALFTLSIDRHNSNMIQEVGGVSAIVNAMQAHVDSVVVQEMGCACLCNLAVDKQCKMRIVDQEALDAIVLAMVLHSEDAKVQERGCQVLMQLTIMENCKAMQASNIGELFRVAADRFPDICGELADRYLRTMELFIAQYNSAAHA